MVQNHGSGVIYHNKYKNEDTNIVFVNVQTGGLTMKSDVLQIGLKCGKKSFDAFIMPSKPIPSEVTRINGLSSVGRTLYVDGEEVDCLSLTKCVKEMFNFLDDLDGPCVLVAHQADFHVKRLKRIMRICYLHYKFEDIIEGFVDTLSMFRKMFPTRREQGQMTLKRLAKYLLSFSILYCQDASYNAFLVEQLVYRYFDYEDLMKNLKDW